MNPPGGRRLVGTILRRGEGVNGEGEEDMFLGLKSISFSKLHRLSSGVIEDEAPAGQRGQAGVPIVFAVLGVL